MKLHVTAGETSIWGIYVVFVHTHLRSSVCEASGQPRGFFAADALQAMKPSVRRLYKHIIFAGRDYPQGLSVVRRRAKAEFFKNAHLTDKADIAKAMAHGKWMLKELEGVSRFRKYRTLKKRYYD